jgi:hypothetical protein
MGRTDDDDDDEYRERRIIILIVVKLSLVPQLHLQEDCARPLVAFPF